MCCLRVSQSGDKLDSCSSASGLLLCDSSSSSRPRSTSQSWFCTGGQNKQWVSETKRRWWGQWSPGRVWRPAYPTPWGLPQTSGSDTPHLHRSEDHHDPGCRWTGWRLQTRTWNTQTRSESAAAPPAVWIQPQARQLTAPPPDVRDVGHPLQVPGDGIEADEEPGEQQNRDRRDRTHKRGHLQEANTHEWCQHRSTPVSGQEVMEETASGPAERWRRLR